MKRCGRSVRSWCVLAASMTLAAGAALAVDYQLYNSSFPHEQYNSEGTSSAPSGGPTAPSSVLSTISRSYPEGFATITRDASELYVLAGLTPPSPNYISKINPTTLVEVKRTTLDCPASSCPANLVWAPSGVAHANGYLYVVTESRLWKLDNNINIVGYVDLPLKTGFYNSIKVLSDGNLVVKGTTIPSAATQYSTLSLITPDLTVLVPNLILPEVCIARITDLVHNGQEQVYITGATTVIRYNYTSGGSPYLTQDPTWSYSYRAANDTATSAGGLPTFIGNQAYFADNAQSSSPTGPIHLYRINIDNSADNQMITPFPGTTNGFHINKHLVDPVSGMIVISDSNNAVTAGYTYSNGNMVQMWSNRIRSKVIAAAASSSGYLFITDVAASGEYLDIVNIRTGQILSKTLVGPALATEGALSIGYNKDVFYVGFTGVLARVYNQ